MLGKLAVALRSIASALEEIEENKSQAGWELVEEQEDSAAGVTGQQPIASQPCGSDVGDTRFYTVLSGGKRPELRGLWSGEASVTWKTLESKLEGGRLAGSGSRLRRVENFSQGLQMWEKQFPGEEMMHFQVKGLGVVEPPLPSVK